MYDYFVTKVNKYSNHLVLSLKAQDSLNAMRYLPGQYAAISFMKRGRWSPVRCFSIVSNWGEDELQFAMRDSGLFTSNIARLNPGDKVRVQGPFGSFTIDEDYDEKIIMLAGGIGITPFISMLRNIRDTRLNKRIILLYACKSTEDLPFYEEIMEFSETIKNFSVLFFVSNGMGDTKRRIHSRTLDADVVSRVTNDNYVDYTYFICGPKSFNSAFSDLLNTKNVDQDRIVTESFAQADKMSFEVSSLNFSVPKLTYSLVAVSLIIAFGFFMSIDLIRYAPKVSTANNSKVIQSSVGSSTSSGSSTTISPSTGSTTSNNSARSYSPPVSSVS